MSPSPSARAVQALAVAAVGAPAALLAHLLVTGAPASTAGAVLATLAVLATAAAVPARRSATLAAVTALTQLAAHTVLALMPTATPARPPACIPAVGRAASLGMQLAVLRSDDGCPSGTLALGTAAAATLTAVLVALAILAGNAVLALLTGLVLGRALVAGAVVAGVGHLLVRVLARTAQLLHRPAAVPPPGRPVPRPEPEPRPHASLLRSPGAVTRRGPPLAVAPAS